MARFRAEAIGQRGSASRLGTVNSGMRAYACGWDTGAAISCTAIKSIPAALVAEGGTGDRIDVERTSGSNGGTRPSDSIGWVDDGPTFFHLNGVDSQACRDMAAELRGEPSDWVDTMMAAADLLERLAPDPSRSSG